MLAPSFRTSSALDEAVSPVTFAPSSHEEWIMGDGAGGYASLCALFYPTRRQHGLLVTTPDSVDERHVLLSRYEEVLEADETTYQLNGYDYCAQAAVQRHPQLEKVHLYPTPCFYYRCGELLVTRTIDMPQAGAVSVRYHFHCDYPRALRLRLRPLLAFRAADRLTHENLHINTRCEQNAHGVLVRPYGSLPALQLTVVGACATFHVDPVWYRNLRLVEDLQRGYEGHEDHFSPGEFEIECLAPGTVTVVAQADLAGLANTIGLPNRTPIEDASDPLHRSTVSLRDCLQAAARVYFWQRPNGSMGILAGFPWFAEWGRDTFVALPGLTLACGDYARALTILRGALDFLDRGMIPNIFGRDRQNSRYNSLDAALWYIRALDLYDQATGRDPAFAREFVPFVVEIVQSYRHGINELGVRCDPQEHLLLTDAHHNLTWMDAVVDGVPVTPRLGAPVEINALWYAAIDYAAELARRTNQLSVADELAQRLATLGHHFIERFWDPDRMVLADGWCDPDLSPDAECIRNTRKIRPNMVIAAALARSPLSTAMRQVVVASARAKLLTPRGLRSLAHDDPDYQPRCEGSSVARDRAYHQGTVWPWLLGFWVEASVRAGTSAALLQELAQTLQGFAPHLHEVGLGQVSEIFDGNPPHLPRGTMAQAWSVAELLRALQMIEEWPCES